MVTHRIQSVGVVVKDTDGRLLLVKRGHAPQIGRWTIPGGKVEPDETLEEAAAREVIEETGLTVRIGRELGVLDIPIDETHVYEVHDFASEYSYGELTPGDDATDAGWFSADDLLALPLTDNLIDYLTGFDVYP